MENMTTTLSVPDTVLQWTTPIQRYIMELLEKWNDKWERFSLDDIVLNIAKISKTAMRPTPLGDEVPDPVARMNANKLLLELMWVYKKWWWNNVNMNFDLWALLYNQWQQNAIPPSAEVIS
jgi:hypothetical protein